MTRLLVLTLLILLVTEIGPPIYRASVPEGLAVVEAHDKPKPDPPKPGPGRDPDGLEVGGQGHYWYVVRRTRPTVPIWGPFLTPETECRGWERRFPGIYICRRLP